MVEERCSDRPPTRPPLTGKWGLAYCRVVPDELFKALSDPTRRAILDELVDRNGQTLFEICSRLTMKHGINSTRQAISQHLAVLEGAGLVAVERRGRHKFHHLDTTPLDEIRRRWPSSQPHRRTT
jgi:DNA-binding transcriptional ArsR family regulator